MKGEIDLNGPMRPVGVKHSPQSGFPKAVGHPRYRPNAHGRLQSSGYDTPAMFPVTGRGEHDYQRTLLDAGTNAMMGLAFG